MAQRRSQGLILLLLPPLLFFLTTFLPPCTAMVAYPNIPRALVTPIAKDPLTNLYSISLNDKSSFLLDIAGPLLWSPCPAHHVTVPCNSVNCAAARAFSSPLCPGVNTTPRKRPCVCHATPMNPVTGKCTAAELTLSDVGISTTDGRNPTGKVTVPGLISSCAPPEMLGSLPPGAVGVAGLARSALALPSQFSSRLSVKRQFAICLPSTSNAPGVAFFGDKPFYLLPPTQPEVTSLLAYTKLKKNPANAGYYLALEGIAVNGRAVGFPGRVFEFDAQGRGGARLSTAAPYTALRSDVYRPFLGAYEEATRGIPRVEKVAPFELCLNASALGVTRVGYAVPQVDLLLEGGKNWTVFGANTFKQVDDGTACLAVVDGGAKAEAAVVVGGFQMENNFLLFDVGGSMLGFSSSLSFFRTTCFNFNFTAAA